MEVNTSGTSRVHIMRTSNGYNISFRNASVSFPELRQINNHSSCMNMINKQDYVKALLNSRWDDYYKISNNISMEFCLNEA